MNLAELPRVLVEWLDANTQAEWVAHGEVTLNVTPCETYGVLLSHDAEQLIVAGTVALDAEPDVQHAHMIFAIPRGMVRRVRVVSAGGDLALVPAG